MIQYNTVSCVDDKNYHLMINEDHRLAICSIIQLLPPSQAQVLPSAPYTPTLLVYVPLSTPFSNILGVHGGAFGWQPG